MSDTEIKHNLAQHFVGLAKLLIAQGHEPDQAVGAMFASGVAGLRAIHGTRVVADMLNHMALEIVREEALATIAGDMTEAATNLSTIVADHSARRSQQPG